MKFVLLVLFTCSLFVALNSRAVPEKKVKALTAAAKPFDLVLSTLKAFKAQFPVGTALTVVQDAVTKLTAAIKTPAKKGLKRNLKQKLKYLNKTFDLKLKLKKKSKKIIKAKY